MNAKSAEILSNPHPCGHIVYPYTNEGSATEAVSLFAGSGLRDGEGVILIMTAGRCESTIARLKADGFEIETLHDSGRLICIPAAELLSTILVNGQPDADSFRTVLGRLITRSRMSTGRGTGAKVRALIWSSDRDATFSLEELWNEIIDKHRVSLMCAYAFTGHGAIPDSLQALHSHSMPVS